MSKKIKNRLLIIGAGKNGFAVMDIAKNLNMYDEICFLDDNKNKRFLIEELQKQVDQLQNEHDSAVNN